MKKLPKIYQNDLSKSIKNNKKVYNSLKEKDEVIEVKKVTNKRVDSKKTLTVKEKVKELIKSNNYIFNTKVKLIFDNYEKECHIAGVVNNHIITMDNEIIKIDDLKDIEY
ncbi:MAG: hypothetical protein IKN63_05805 [Bacilli bacterium]|nr:hypothetical protein [Bacilli bacterium]